MKEIETLVRNARATGGQNNDTKIERVEAKSEVQP